MTLRRSGNGLLIGGGALMAGVLAFGIVVGKTIGAGAPPAEAVAPSTSVDAADQGVDLEATPASRSTPLAPEVLRLAVDRAPFEEGRRPSTPYRLPGSEPAQGPRVEFTPPPPAPDFQLLGAVSGANGGLAIVRVGDSGDPQMIAVGESIEGYTLSNVRGDRATFAGGDRMVALAVQSPSPEVQTTGRNQRGNQGRGNQNNNNQGRQGGQGGQAATARTFEISGDILQQLQSQGINAAAVLQQLQQGGNAGQIIQRITGAMNGAAGGATQGGAAPPTIIMRQADGVTGFGAQGGRAGGAPAGNRR